MISEVSPCICMTGLCDLWSLEIIVLTIKKKTLASWLRHILHTQSSCKVDATGHGTGNASEWDAWSVSEG